MSIYPRRYSIEEGKNAQIVVFDWDVPGFSLWGARIIYLFLKFRLGAKEIYASNRALESFIAFELNAQEFMIYQDDGFFMNGLQVSALSPNGKNEMAKIVGLFNASIFFKRIYT